MNLPDEVRAAVEDWTDPYESADECAMLAHFHRRGLILWASELRDGATRPAREEGGFPPQR